MLCFQTIFSSYPSPVLHWHSLRALACQNTIFLPFPGARRALIHVPREPVRALAFLAAVARPVDARDGRMPATTAVGERSRGKGGDSPAVRTRPLFALFCPMFEPRRLKMPQPLTRFIPVLLCSNQALFGVAYFDPYPRITKRM